MAEVSFERGMNLRLARHLMPPGTLLQSLNVVPDVYGSVKTRQGSVLVGSIPGFDMNSYYVLHGHVPGAADHSYQGVTNPSNNQFSLYRDFTTVLAGPTGTGVYLNFADMSEFQNDHPWVFFAGGQDSLRFKDDGIRTQKWGIAAPTHAPTLATAGGGNLNGTYTYRTIFVRHDFETGTRAVAWGNPSPESAVIGTSNQQVQLTNIARADLPGPNLDGQVTHTYIFRTAGNMPGAWFLVGVILSNQDTFLDNRADVDGPLPSSLPSSLLEFDNGQPPAFASIVVHQDRMWGVTGRDNRVYFSKPQRPEAFSATGYLEVGPLADTAVVVTIFNGRLYVGTETRLIQIHGTDESTFYPDNTPLPIGVTSAFSMASGLRGLYWRGPDGVYVWNGASAANITDATLYPLFHGQPAADFLPAAFDPGRFGPQYFSAGAWFEGRYYLTYITAPPGVQTMVYDELTEGWYPDSRPIRRYFYDRRDQYLIGTSTDGGAYRLNEGTNDAGTPILWGIQTRDIIEGDGRSDQSLQEVTVDFDSQGSTVQLFIRSNFGAASSAPVLVSSSGRSQQIVTMAPNSIVGKALSYVLLGTGPATISRLFPRVLVYPESRRSFDTLPLDLGYPGPKRIVGFWLDAELTSSGTLTTTLTGDGVVQPLAPPWTTVGRVQQDRLVQSFDATVVDLSIRGSVPWRLYPSTFLSWVPLPPEYLVHEVPPSDFGISSLKDCIYLLLDLEMITAGTVTVSVLCDGVVRATVPLSGVGRLTSGRVRLPRGTHGRIIEVRFSGTALWRAWQAELAYHGLGSREGLQLRPLLAGAGGTGMPVQRTPLGTAA